MDDSPVVKTQVCAAGSGIVINWTVLHGKAISAGCLYTGNCSRVIVFVVMDHLVFIIDRLDVSGRTGRVIIPETADGISL